MSVQVFDGGLPVPPFYDVPQYPDHAFDCDFTRQLVEKVMMTGLPVASIAREHWAISSDGRTRELLSVSLLNPEGEEIASYNPTMKRGQFHAKTNGHGRIIGKVWLAATDPVDITGYIEMCRRYSPTER